MLHKTHPENLWRQRTIASNHHNYCWFLRITTATHKFKHLISNHQPTGRSRCNYSMRIGTLPSLPSVVPAVRIGVRPTSVLPLAIFCALNLVSMSSAASGEDESSGDLFGGLPLIAQLILMLLLIMLSAIFCGLTLGVMGLDTNSLEIIAEAGQEPDRSYAKELLPIRKLGHQSLSTLIIGNMLANVLIAQLISDVTPAGDSASLISFVVATLVILIFAEVVPMSVCKGPHALEIATAGVPILRAFLVILYPIAKPLGMLLDLITPHDAGQIYDRNELRKLMRVHCESHGDRSGLDTTELKMLLGAMDFHEAIVGNIMTPIDQVFMIEDTTVADRSLVEILWREGKSRVPIFHGQRNNIIGIMFVKDLVSMLAFRSTAETKGPLHHHVVASQQHQDLTVASLLGSNRRDLVRARYSATLPCVLRMIQSGNLHMLLVEEDADANGASYGRYAGIVTLEDVIEELIKGEIRDEYDDEVSSDEELVLPASTDAVMSTSEVDEGPPAMSVTAPPGSSSSPASPWPGQPPLACAVSGKRKIVVPKMPPKLPRINFSSFYVTGAPLTSDHRWVLADYLQRAVGAFAPWKISHIKLLLDEVGDREVRDIEELDVPVGLRHEGSLSDPSFDLRGSASTSFDPPPLNTSTPVSPVVASHSTTGRLRGSAGHRAVVEQTRKDLVLYEYEKRSTTMVLVLSGGVRLVVGHDLFNHECRSFTLLGEAALSTSAELSKGPGGNFSMASSPLGPPTMFIPDFTAIVSRPSRLLVITARDYERVDGYFQRSGKHHTGNLNNSFANGAQRMQSEDDRHRTSASEQMT